MNVRTLNIATVVVAVLLFTGFVVLAEGIGGDDNNKRRLDATASTTTAVTLPRVTTSRPPTTLVVVPSTTQVTIAPAPTPTPTPTVARTTATTARKTTTTVRRSTNTTRRPTATTTATTIASGPNGRVTEASDNGAGFVHNSDGTTSEGATPVSADPGAFVFKITTKVISTSGTSAQVRFTIEVTNQRGKRITFPEGLRVSLNLTSSNGAPFTLVLDAPQVTSFDNGETITAATTTAIEGYGSYNVSGSVLVDYGS